MVPMGRGQDSHALDELQEHPHCGCSLILVAVTPWGFSDVADGQQQAGLCLATSYSNDHIKNPD